MIIDKLKKGLFDWFWLESSQFKTFRHIDNVCVRLFNQHYPKRDDSKNAKYEMFYPLMRCGVIEFYGDGKFGLSPTCALYGKNSIVFVNIPPLKYDTVANFNVKDIGIKICDFTNENFSFLQTQDIPISEFLLSELLLNISSLDKIIENWDSDSVVDSTNHFVLNSRFKWVLTSSYNTVGVHKKGDEYYSQRILKIAENNWKLIPERDSNIDAINIAVLWSQIQNNWDIGVTYFSNEQKLVVDNIFFPIIIERLLYINTLLVLKNAYEVKKRIYYINNADLTILNKLLGYKIEIR